MATSENPSRTRNAASRPAAKRTTAAKSTRPARPRASASRPSSTAKVSSTSALNDTETAVRSTASLVGDYAERAVLIPVGAALIARDRVVSSVGDVISSYSSPAKAQTQLRKFERRGTTARKRLEREVRKTRTRFERELRQRRGSLDKHRDAWTKSISSQVEQTSTQMQARLKDGAELANRVQERVLSLV